ncbi:MAG: hypothetical protein K2Y10_02595 [Burkholderiaceae bacterium]|nr:hypothetical protein [Burkholderiaceae bacterium]
MLGITLFLGSESTPSHSLEQSAGDAYRLPRLRIKKEINLLLHYLPQRNVMANTDTIRTTMLPTV